MRLSTSRRGARPSATMAASRSRRSSRPPDTIVVRPWASQPAVALSSMSPEGAPGAAARSVRAANEVEPPRGAACQGGCLRQPEPDRGKRTLRLPDRNSGWGPERKGRCEAAQAIQYKIVGGLDVDRGGGSNGTAGMKVRHGPASPVTGEHYVHVE